MRIYLVSANGGASAPMLPGTGMEVDPKWSPDGNQIMFGAVRLPKLGATEATGDIEILDLRSHRVSVLPGSEGLTAPRWSPDGRYASAGAIGQPKSGEAAVRLYDFSTRQWTPFEQDPVDNKW
jgi:Tol biopolymer transport system component